MMLRLLAGCVLLCTGLAAANAAPLTVFAAASLKEALDAQVRSFERASGHRVVVSYAGTNALAKQIESGAPADVFVSADADWMDYVDQRKLLAPGSRVDLLRNVLVLVAPRGSNATLTLRSGFALATALRQEKLAMANPDSVPAGKYGRSALESLGVWKEAEPRIARAENVRAALALVSRGEAPLGIVYRTDALADRSVRIVDAFPASSHPPIVYPAAIVAGSKSPGARPLLDYLASPAARGVWEQHGFVVAH